jgi:hypothetical protein
MVTETQLPTSKHFRLEKLAEGVYAALAIDGGGAMCNAGIVDLGDRALVFDTFWTPEASQDLLTAAEQVTGHAVVYIVNSHYNADHVNGNQVFAPATTIISTSRTRELLIERGNGFLHWAREHLAEEVHEDEKKLAAETNEGYCHWRWWIIRGALAKTLQAEFSSVSSPERPPLPEARLHPISFAGTFTDFLATDTAPTSGFGGSQAETFDNGKESTSRAVHRRVVLPAAMAGVRWR